jgi:hypothetical protein
MLRYLNETKELSILYKRASELLILKTWTNSSWDKNSNDSRSTHDHLLFMRDKFIEWKFTKQISVALSRTETEYINQTSAIINVMWAKELLNEMSIERTMSNKNSTIIYADNQRTIKLANNLIFQKRTKHIVVKYHYAKDLISQEDIKLKFKFTYASEWFGLIRIRIDFCHIEFNSTSIWFLVESIRFDLSFRRFEIENNLRSRTRLVILFTYLLMLNIIIHISLICLKRLSLSSSLHSNYIRIDY